jgi:hypothetical protein
MKYQRSKQECAAARLMSIDHPIGAKLVKLYKLGQEKENEGAHRDYPKDYWIEYDTKAEAIIEDVLNNHASYEWQPIETAPKDGTYVLLAGPSGYIGTPLRVEVCKYDADYRPLQPWVDYGGQSFLHSGGPPTHWMPLPPAPPSVPGKH